MAFNIDIEVGLSPDNPRYYRFYLASMTNTWTVDRTPQEFEAFTKKLMSDKEVKSDVPLPKVPDKNDELKVEAYLGRLGCTSATLRWAGFHEFLEVPEQMKRGLSFVKDKPFGKTIADGVLKVPSRYLGTRKPLSRYVAMSQESSNSAFVLVYAERSEKYPMAVIKFTPATTFQVLPEKETKLKHAFVFKVGRRQWVFQAQNEKEFKNWKRTAKKMLAAAGGKRVAKNPDGGKGIKSPKGLKQIGGSLKKLGMTPRQRAESQSQDRKTRMEEAKKLNEQLRADLKELKKQREEYRLKIEEWEAKKSDQDEAEQKMREEKWRSLDDDLVKLEEVHTEKREELRLYLENLHKKIEEKNRQEGFYKVGSLFSDGFSAETADVQADEQGGQLKPETGKAEEDEGVKLDEDGNMTDYQKEEIQGATTGYSQTYMNAHKHKHIHLLNHIHTHYHNDTTEKAETHTQTQTLAHTIVHTQTQFKIKKSLI